MESKSAETGVGMGVIGVKNGTRSTDIANYKTWLNLFDTHTHTNLNTFNKSETAFKSKLKYNFSSRD